MTLITLAAWRIDRVGTRDTSEPADLIIVLGARVESDGQASTTLATRVMHAVALYRRGLAPKILFSGGVGACGASEASVARELAIENGVPKEACVVEEGSHSTRENATKSLALIKEHGWTRAIVVTDPYHLPRALHFFEREGLHVTGSPVLEAPRHRDATERVWWTLREVAALTQWTTLRSLY